MLPSALLPPAGLAQPVVLQRSPWSVSQPKRAPDAACLSLQPQGTQQWTMLTTPRVSVLRGVRGQLPRGSRRPPSSPAPTLCRQGQDAAVLPSCAHRGCCLAGAVRPSSTGWDTRCCPVQGRHMPCAWRMLHISLSPTSCPRHLTSICNCKRGMALACHHLANIALLPRHSRQTCHGLALPRHCPQD